MGKRKEFIRRAVDDVCCITKDEAYEVLESLRQPPLPEDKDDLLVKSDGSGRRVMYTHTARLELIAKDQEVSLSACD